MNGKVIIAEEYLEPVEELSDAQAGELMKTVMRYSVTGELPETEDQAVTILFMLMKSYIDRNQKAYEETCRRNRENGKRGGRPKTERLSEKPSGYSENPENPIQNQNQNQNQIQNHDQNQNQIQIQNHDQTSPDGEERRERELKLPKEIPLPPELNQDFVQEAFRDFREHRRKLRKPMTTKAEEMIIADLAKLAKGDAVAAVKILEQSIKNGWQGVFPLKEDKPQRGTAERMAAL